MHVHGDNAVFSPGAIDDLDRPRTMSRHRGFSVMTWTPALRAARITSLCRWSGVATAITSRSGIARIFSQAFLRSSFWVLSRSSRVIFLSCALADFSLWSRRQRVSNLLGRHFPSPVVPPDLPVAGKFRLVVNPRMLAR